MTNVLIVSKTKMFNGACIGGIVIPDLNSVRLLNADGTYHSLNTDFEVGQLWEMNIKKSDNLISPHCENVLILSKKIKTTYKNFWEFIDERKLEKIIWNGSPQNLFQGLLQWTVNRHGYISKKNGVLEVSTGFWIPDKDLVYSDKFYYYIDEKQDLKYALKYVGFEIPIGTILASTKVRVSLAKWWHPRNIDMEDRCYLQISGWY